MATKIKASTTVGVAITNKDNVFSAKQTFNNMVNSQSSLEKCEIVNVAPSVIQHLDLLSSSLYLFTVAPTANWGINIRGGVDNSLNSLMSISETITVVAQFVMGNTTYYNNVVSIDGVSVTPKWLDGAAPIAGNANSIDIYTFTITKIGNGLFSVLASMTRATDVVPPAIFSASLVILSNTVDYNLKTAVLAAGWNGTSAVNITCTVKSNIVIGSSSVHTPAFITGSGWPATSVLNLVIESGAYIVGAGGAGGPSGGGGASYIGGAGQIGGDALKALASITVTNNGTIAGGGGGGSGGNGVYMGDVAGGGGGGGAGSIIGIAGPGQGGGGINGSPGTLTTGGSGGYGGSGGTAGGAGGALGANGGASGSAGGVGGAAVTGNSFITWAVNGIKLGTVIA